ncbi:hypothetical protein ACFFGR_10935 [Arthrobacter liuii]|uniref:Type IV secretion system protein VirB3 n=1 Tax=Arthrobacter liuii TaxID=1476996 RepID=A0ABQ2AZE2_9MICC|nr:hypothetical protein [Arthrobacter liuii]GGI03168.1 hypothetical protein GCM10007170_46530 [Arthrobacter liuii]
MDNNDVGVKMVLGPALGIMSILYAVFMIVVAVLAVYALVLAIVFLPLRIDARHRRTVGRYWNLLYTGARTSHHVRDWTP